MTARPRTVEKAAVQREIIAALRTTGDLRVADSLQRCAEVRLSRRHGSGWPETCRISFCPVRHRKPSGRFRPPPVTAALRPIRSLAGRTQLPGSGQSAPALAATGSGGLQTFVANTRPSSAAGGVRIPERVVCCAPTSADLLSELGASMRRAPPRRRTAEAAEAASPHAQPPARMLQRTRETAGRRRRIRPAF